MKWFVSAMDILYEDNHLIAVNKTCNEIVQGDKTGDTPLVDLVKAYLKAKYNKPGAVYLGLPHRLDRPTSGVVLFAKTSKALTRLNAMFGAHDQIRKTYWAICANCPQPMEGRLEHYLIRREEQNKSYLTKPDARGAKQALLNYRVIARSDRYYLVEVALETGRHHQIRCQLSAIGCPIKGDLKYGAARCNPDGGICLHARRIEFVHPVSHQPISITAPVPDDPLWHAITGSVSDG